VSEDKVVEHSLWTTALITYVRCFTSGVRTRLDRSIFGDDEEMLRKHDYYKDIRDKHLAHSVNPFEGAETAIAVANYDSEEPYVYQALTAHFSRSTEDSPTMRALADLARWLQGYARQKHEEALKKVRVKGKELTRDQLRDLRPLKVKPLEGYDAHEAAKLPRPPKP